MGDYSNMSIIIGYSQNWKDIPLTPDDIYNKLDELEDEFKKKSKKIEFYNMLDFKYVVYGYEIKFHDLDDGALDITDLIKNIPAKAYRLAKEFYCALNGCEFSNAKEPKILIHNFFW